ncbi:MAG TPA: hypothetical protein VH143_23340 [Kofleriaceae bacterium]|jgi:hypothetical protein|nr:hypothetical protein [Kofleriaceae bacterium]
MRRGSRLRFLIFLLLTGCPGGGGGVGDRCDDSGDCETALQCVDSACAPLCVRAPDCGAGYACDSSGYCAAATKQDGDTCSSETDCVTGLSCELGSDTDAAGTLVSSCTPSSEAAPAGASCSRDSDCHNKLCALGHCLDLCNTTSDCGVGTACVQVPRVEANGALFEGCLQSSGLLAWNIPDPSPANQVSLPIPETTQSISVAFTLEDSTQEAEIRGITDPMGDRVDIGSASNTIRFIPQPGESVLAMPSSPDTPLFTGAYLMEVLVQNAPYTGSAAGDGLPAITAVVKLDDNVLLDLHFYFLDFDEFPCAGSAFEGAPFDATAAQTASFFQTDFVGSLRSVFATGGVALGSLDYTDLRDHPDLDGLDVSNASELLSLGSNAGGVNVFFVRSLSPAGLQAYGPNPGPAGLGGTAQSGVIVALDSLCYRSWTDVARVAAHEIARYMGLYDNIDIDNTVDPISDSDESSANLMFYSDLGGTELSQGQKTILRRSVVLQ